MALPADEAEFIRRYSLSAEDLTQIGRFNKPHNRLGFAVLLCYLLGEVEIADGRGPARTGRLDSVDRYNPARYSGDILQLHYARAQELGPWLDLIAVRGEVVVQFWLKPGDAAVMLGPGEEREAEKIPEQLRPFL